MTIPFRHILLLMAAGLALSCRTHEVPQEPDVVPPSPETPEVFDYTVLENAGHPRLLMTEKDFAALKKRLGSDKASNVTLCNIHHVIIVKAQAYAAAAQITSDPSSHENNVSEILALCYAWRTTGNAIFLTKVLKDIDAVIGWKSLGSSDLGVGEHSLALAVAYDWLYQELSEKQRYGLCKLLMDKAVKASLKSSFRQFCGNWNQVGNGGIMSAALALYEQDKTSCMVNIETGLVDNRKVLRKLMAGGGGYPEGPSYWNYGMTYQAALLQSMLNIFNHTATIMDIQGLMDSGMYALMSHGTMNTCFSYADGGASSDQHMLASWWYAAMKQDASLCFAEKHLLEQDKYLSSYSRLLPLVPAFLKDFNPDAPGSVPTASLWHCDGEMPLCIVRRGWTYSPSDLYLGIKGGNCNTWKTMSTAHGHMDAGSFVFEAEGVRWSDDIMRPSYSNWFDALQKAGSRSGDTSQTGLRWSTFNVNVLCHSTLVSYTNDGSVSGKLHPSDQYVDGHASILEIHDDPARQGAVLDMSGPMKGQVKSARREIDLLADGTLEVTDRIQALDGQDCVLEWRMLSMANAAVQGQGITLTSRDDAGISRTLTVKSSQSGVSPVYATWQTAVPSDWSGFTYYQTISKRVIAGWKATVPAGTTVTFTTQLKKN